MENKSVAYMLVAVLVGVTLITAVPDQIARYATPQQMLSTQSGDSELTVLPKSGEGGVERYWDSMNTSEVNSTDDFEIWFEITNSTDSSGIWNSTEVEDLDFKGTEEDRVTDLNEQVADLADELTDLSEDFGEVKSDISDVEGLAADAVEAANAATEAVGAVAVTANSASEAAMAAAETANASSSLSTLNMFIWYAIDALIAVGVYLLAKRRFS